METKAFDCVTSLESSDLVLIPVPWSATVSHKTGTKLGPELIREGSHQLDFFKPGFNTAYNNKIHFLPCDPGIEKLNQQAEQWVQKYKKGLNNGAFFGSKSAQASSKIQQYQHEFPHGPPNKKGSKKACSNKTKTKENYLKLINQASQELTDRIYQKAQEIHNKGKIPALVGGDHSVSEGLIAFIGDCYKGDFGILHLDAHADLRFCYEGLARSHASIMNNVLKLNPGPKKLVQVGLRDFCEEEYQIIKSDKRIQAYFDEELYSLLFEGQTWAKICQKILSQLPQQIYISLDVDVLSWENAPGTGTPVPGGLSFNQLLYLLSEIQRQNKKLLAFDVVETSPGDSDTTNSAVSQWNGNVSARLIYHLSGLALHSFNKL